MELNALIRISQIGNGSKGHLLVEGTLSDGWVDALEASWLEVQSQINGKPLYIDLSGVTYVDDKGRELLARIIRGGAELGTAGIMIRTLVEEITREIGNTLTK
jgi:anti-anti-sigma regulatory factor